MSWFEGLFKRFRSNDKNSGSSPPEVVKAVTAVKEAIPMQKLILEALKHYGMTEVAGQKTHPVIARMLAELGYPFSDDETSWCGTFVSYICTQCSISHPVKGYGAREWLNWGEMVDEPKLGDIVVFWRTAPTDWQGHVALFVNRVGGTIFTLGGNQSNQVNITGYPASRLLGYRRNNASVA